MSLWLLCLTTVVVAGVGSVLPFSPIEPYLVALPTIAPARWLIPLALLATVTHMLGKALLYLASRGATHAVPARYHRYLADTRRRLLGSRRARYATLLSATTFGLPPLYVVTVLCGALRMPFAEFLIVGTIGRAARFVTLVALPSIIVR